MFTCFIYCNICNIQTILYFYKLFLKIELKLLQKTKIRPCIGRCVLCNLKRMAQSVYSTGDTTYFAHIGSW